MTKKISVTEKGKQKKGAKVFRPGGVQDIARGYLEGASFQISPKGVCPSAKRRAHCVVGGNPTE